MERIKTIIYFGLFNIFAILPVHALAAGSDKVFESGFTGPPPTKAADVTAFLGHVIDLLAIVVGAVALSMIIWGGVMLATSWGNEDKITKGKTILTNTIIGFALSTAGYVIVKFVILALGGTV